MAKSKKAKSQAISKPIAKEALLATPMTSYQNYMPSFYQINPKAEQIILPYERREQIRYGRELFAKMPIVSAAIMNKNKVAVGNGWQPIFSGLIRDDKDKVWVEAASKWMIKEYFPNCNWMGSNFSFQDSLVMTGKDCDVDGGSLMLYRNTQNGLPRIQLIPTDQIGSRDGVSIVKGGTWDGYDIYDGIIRNSDNMPVALCILGDSAEKDQYISLFNCQYIYEPVWSGGLHGVSKIANAVTNLMDVRDINDLLKITVKNFAAKGIIHKNAKGAAPRGKKILGVETPAPATNTQVASQMQNKIFFESINKGGTEYISSTDGSEIIPFNFDRPSPNTEAFIFRISSEAIASLGWFIELVTPSRLTGTSVRSIQDQARKLVIDKQRLLERRAKAIVQYGLATAMRLNLIPMTNNKTWNDWSFSMPGELTVDSGYDNTAQIESLKMGISTKAEICARRGKDWKEVSIQTDKELRDLFTRAQALAKEFNISEAEAREWISKRDIDVIVPQLPKEAGNENDNENDPNDLNEDKK